MKIIILLLFFALLLSGWINIEQSKALNSKEVHLLSLIKWKNLKDAEDRREKMEEEQEIIKELKETVVVEKEEIEEKNIASWYNYDCLGDECRTDYCPGNIYTMATSTCYSMRNRTCASREYERGTLLRIIRKDTGEFTTCRVNDYGPEEWTARQIDLSSKAFLDIAPLGVGLLEVDIQVIE